MSEEQTFRAVAAAAILLGAPIGTYYRLRSRRIGAKITRTDERLWTRIPLKLCGLAGMLLVLCWLLRPQWLTWAAMPLPAWARWIGAPLCALAVPLLAWTFHTLGLNLTDTVATRANSYLVTAGPYRWVRHPFYVTVLLFVSGVTLLSALWPFALTMPAVPVLLALRTPLEERKLIERFGDAYRDYASRTPRYFPRLTAAPRPSRPAGPVD